MTEEKKYQVTITNEKLIEKIEKYAMYGFSSRKEFICAAVLAYENTLMLEERTEKLVKGIAKEILERKEETKRHEALANEYL